MHLRDEVWFVSSRDLWKTDCEHCLNVEIAVAYKNPEVLALLEPYRMNVGGLLPVKQGVEFERILLDSLHESMGSDFIEISKSEAATTKEHIASGVPVIAQAYLENNFGEISWTGYADLLVRDDYDLVSTDSKLFAIKRDGVPDSRKYRVWDIKGSSSAKPKYGLQLAGYVKALQKMGCASERNPGFVLEYDVFFEFEGNKVSQNFDLAMAKVQAKIEESRDKEINLDYISPLHCESESACEQNSCNYPLFCDKTLTSQHDLSLIYRMGQSAQKLRDHGIHSYDQLASIDQDLVVPGVNNLTELSNWARLKVEEDKSGTYFELKPKNEWIPIPSLSLNDVYFDIEWFNPVLSKKAWVFMFGCADNDFNFKSLDSLLYEDELTNFRTFVAERLEALQQDKNSRIYHYHTPEPEHLRKLASFYGELEEEVELICSRMIDLRKIVMSMINPGSNSYSIKAIERYYDADERLHRGGLVKAGDQAMLQFYEALEHCSNGRNSEADNLMSIIREYNKDDCFSTKLLVDWLRGLVSAENKGI